MNTLMPAPVAKPQIGKQAVAARLRAGTPLSSSRVHACESSLAGLPGLYSGSFYSARSVRKAMGPLESPKSAPAGGVVLDPFFGSGTTGQVAQALGRQWIGIELNPAYKALQDARLAQMGLTLEVA